MDYSVRYLPEQRLPDKAKKLLMDAAIAAAHPISPEERAARRANPGPVAVLPEHVAHQIAHRTGIPAERLVSADQGWWRGLAERLETHLPGQRSPIHAISRALVSGRLRPSGSTRPQAVLLLFGPSDTGKAALARSLAREVYGDPRAFLRLDMTDYAEPHSISRLIGSPPGYVGYEDEDMFVTPLRRRPSRVVLLDDVDKAHPRILERLLRVFHEGEISDTRGLSADARQAIFVLTVHLDLSAQAQSRIGFGGAAEDARKAQAADEDLFHDRMAELHNRLRAYIDAFVAVRPVDLKTYGELIDKLLQQQLEALAQRVREEYDIRLSWDDRAVALLRADFGGGDAETHPELIQQKVVKLVTDALLDGDARQGGDLHLSLDAQDLLCARVRERA